MRRKPRIGLALGSGSARGWAHIGVIRELAANGIAPDVVAGTSIGALIGAVYVDGKLDLLEDWVRKLDRKGILRLLDLSVTGGMLRGERLIEFFRGQFMERDFDALPRPFGAVATDFDTGREVWLREGNVADAVRASIATPGLFRPVIRDDRILVDGGLVNPVPVTLARALGADQVIAVDLSAGRMGARAYQEQQALPRADDTPTRRRNFLDLLMSRRAEAEPDSGPQMPSMVDVVNGSIQIMQVHIARSRLAGEPADAIVTPRLDDFGLMDYHRAAEAIEEGRAAVERMLPVIRENIAISTQE
jgi:NTE family protein